MTNLRLSFIAVVLLVVSATLYSFAADSDFDGLVSDVAHRYDAHATRIPMMSLVSLCARFATHGGVKGLRIVEFDDVKAALDVPELTTLVRSHLGPEWQPFINEHDKQGNSQSVIFVRAKGDALRMMIADYDHGELDVVRMELSGDALAKWMKDPQGEAHHHNGKEQTE
jgi:hypothetical protein